MSSKCHDLAGPWLDFVCVCVCVCGGGGGGNQIGQIFGTFYDYAWIILRARWIWPFGWVGVR